MAVGYGLERDITAAYTFIMNNYRARRGRPPVPVRLQPRRLHGARDRLAAAQLRHPAAGPRDVDPVCHPPDERDRRQGQRQGRQHRRCISASSRASGAFSRRAPANRISSASGIPCPRSAGSTIPLKIPYTANNADIQIGRHAIALDERRGFYRPEPVASRGEGGAIRAEGPEAGMVRGLPRRRGRRLSGGGERPCEDHPALDVARGRSRRPAGRCRAPGGHDRGRAGARSRREDARRACAKHLSWRLLEHVPKYHYDYATGTASLRANESRPRRLPPGALIHESVFQRAGYAPRLPSDHVGEP